MKTHNFNVFLVVASNKRPPSWNGDVIETVYVTPCYISQHCACQLNLPSSFHVTTDTRDSHWYTIHFYNSRYCVWPPPQVISLLGIVSWFTNKMFLTRQTLIRSLFQTISMFGIQEKQLFYCPIKQKLY